MKIDNIKLPKSSFLSVEKNLSLIIDKILSNNRLKKLLYYTSKDCLDKPNLTEEETFSLIGKQIKIVPKVFIDGKIENCLVITFNNFIPSDNPEFRESILEFDIFCNYDIWNLGDFSLRPYKIAAEIDDMLDGKRLTGIGTVEFMSSAQKVVDENCGGICLLYRVYQGEEDKRDALTPKERQSIANNILGL